MRCHHKLWNKCAVRADSVHVRHAIVEVNVVIGVVLGELLVVVRVVPVFLDCDAVVLIHFVLIALHRSLCFRRSVSVAFFSVFGGIVFTLPRR